MSLNSNTFEVGNAEAPWRFIAFGIVTSDNLQGNEVIDVWLAELLPFETGSVNENDTVESQTLADINGAPRKVQINRSSKTTARWYCTQDGRQTPPNVSNGETVEIYQYGDNGEYRWVSNGRQPALRRKEHVTYAYSNVNGGREEFNAETSYGQTFSTREGFYRLWTSKGGTEAFSYQFLFDGVNGIAALHDDVGNCFVMKSSAQQVYMRNAAGAYISLLGQAGTIKADSLDIDVPSVKMNKLECGDIEAAKVLGNIINRPKGISVSAPEIPPLREFNIGPTTTGTTGSSGSSRSLMGRVVDAVSRGVRAAFDKKSMDYLEQRVKELELEVFGYHKSED